MAVLGADGRPVRSRPVSLNGRHVLARYDAAQTTDQNRLYWSAADALDADAANSAAVRRTLRNRSRYEVANSCYLRSQVTTRVVHEVFTGPTLMVQSASPGLNSMIETAWWRWAGRVRLADTLRTMVRARIVDGEVFGLLVTRDTGDDVHLDLQPIECDRVSGTTLVPSANYVDGVVLDGAGQPVAYDVLDRHPGASWTPGQTGYRRVPAKYVVHLFRPERPGQHRGIPEVTASLTVWPGLRQYILACIKARVTAASLSLVFETDLPPGLEPDEVSPGAVDIPIGTMFQAPFGWKAKQVQAEHPDDDGRQFVADRVAEAGRALMLPRNLATGDSSVYNFASGRLDHQPYFADIAVSQQIIAERVLEPLFHAWLAEAMRSYGWRFDPEPVPAHVWRWPGQPYTDPEAEANAIARNLQSGVTTLPQEYARRGLDWEDEAARQAEALGLTIEEYKRRLADVLYPPPKT